MRINENELKSHVSHTQSETFYDEVLLYNSRAIHCTNNVALRC